MTPVQTWLVVFSAVLAASLTTDVLRASARWLRFWQARRGGVKIASGDALNACARLLGSAKQKEETEEMFVNRLRVDLFRDFDFHPNHARRLLVALEGGIINAAEFRMLCPGHLSATDLRG